MTSSYKPEPLGGTPASPPHYQIYLTYALLSNIFDVVQMATVGNGDPPKDFAHAFGDALFNYLAAHNIGQSDAARLLGIEAGEGEKRKGGARIYTYCRDSKDGKRPTPDAEILYLALTKLPGFTFEYRGHRVSAEMLNGNGAKRPRAPLPEQKAFEFVHQFNLTRKQGIVAVKVKQRSGRRVEVSLSVDAKAS